MDVIDRRMMIGRVLASMAGKYPRLVECKTIVMDEMATSDNKKEVQLSVVRNYLIFTFIDDLPTVDPNMYIALSHMLAYWNQSSGFVLRPNGTYGTDGSLCTYNNTTGKLLMGGVYGYFPQGETYHVYLFEISDEN